MTFESGRSGRSGWSGRSGRCAADAARYIWGMYTGEVENPVKVEKEIDGERYALSGDLLQRRLRRQMEKSPLERGDAEGRGED